MRFGRLAIVFASCLLLAGCVTIDFQQRIYPDQTMDSAVVFTGSDFVLSGFRGLPVNPALADRFTLDEQNGSIAYRFTRVPIGSVLFEYANGTSASLIKTETAELTSSGGFPFKRYAYTITADAGLGEGDEQSRALAGSIKATYTVDVFGSITGVSANGVQLDKDTAQFIIGPFGQNTFRVEFREFFLSSWFR